MRSGLGGRNEAGRAARALQVAQAGRGRDLSPSLVSSVRFGAAPTTTSASGADRNRNRKQTQADEIHLVRATLAEANDCDLEPSSLESAHGQQTRWGRHSAGRANDRDESHLDSSLELAHRAAEDDSLSSSPSLGLSGFVYRVSSDDSARKGRAARKQQVASASGSPDPARNSSSSSSAPTYDSPAPGLARLRSWSPFARKLLWSFGRSQAVSSIAGSEPALNRFVGGRRTNSASPGYSPTKRRRKRAARRRRPESSQAALWPERSVSSSSVFALYASRYARDKLVLALRLFKSWYHQQLTYHHLSSRMEFNRQLFERWYSSKGRPLSLRALDPYDQIVIWIAGKSMSHRFSFRFSFPRPPGGANVTIRLFVLLASANILYDLASWRELSRCTLALCTGRSGQRLW